MSPFFQFQDPYWERDKPNGHHCTGGAAHANLNPLASLVTAAKPAMHRLTEEVSTDELTRLVAEHLRQVNPSLSGAYVATENLKVRSAPDVSVGVAEIPNDLVKRFKISSGQRVKVSHLNSKAEMAVEPARSVDPREIRLNKVDLYKLGAYEGAKVSVTFPH